MKKISFIVWKKKWNSFITISCHHVIDNKLSNTFANGTCNIHTNGTHNCTSISSNKFKQIHTLINFNNLRYLWTSYLSFFFPSLEQKSMLNFLFSTSDNLPVVEEWRRQGWARFRPWTPWPNQLVDVHQGDNA